MKLRLILPTGTGHRSKSKATIQVSGFDCLPAEGRFEGLHAEGRFHEAQLYTHVQMRHSPDLVGPVITILATLPFWI